MTRVGLEAGEGHVGSVVKSPPQPSPAGWDPSHHRSLALLDGTQVMQEPGGQPLCRERTGPERDVLGAGEWGVGVQTRARGSGQGQSSPTGHGKGQHVTRLLGTATWPRRGRCAAPGLCFAVGCARARLHWPRRPRPGRATAQPRLRRGNRGRSRQSPRGSRPGLSSDRGCGDCGVESSPRTRERRAGWSSKAGVASRGLEASIRMAPGLWLTLQARATEGPRLGARLAL